MLTQDRLKEVLSYDPDLGQFRWLVNVARRTNLKGSIAGCLDGKGYLTIKIDRKKYYGSQLAFLYMTGRFARPTVDHKDRDPSNMRWNNLREATRTQNCVNRKPMGRSGLKGACWQAKEQKWVARIRVNGRRLFLGMFDTAEEASAVYLTAARQHHGEFAPGNHNAASI